MKKKSFYKLHSILHPLLHHHFFPSDGGKRGGLLLDIMQLLFHFPNHKAQHIIASDFKKMSGANLGNIIVAID
eukprot:3597834-Ditylum_brightwellii.AAC.1